jgi:hypothetical protein
MIVAVGRARYLEMRLTWPSEPQPQKSACRTHSSPSQGFLDTYGPSKNTAPWLQGAHLADHEPPGEIREELFDNVLFG